MSETIAEVIHFQVRFVIQIVYNARLFQGPWGFSGAFFCTKRF